MAPPPTAEESAQWPLWGGVAQVVVRGEHAHLAETLASASEAVDGVVAEVDKACSRFRADSEVSRLADAHGDPVEVSDVLAEALAAALRAARLSDGAVDPTLGRAMIGVGYDRDWDAVKGLPADRVGTLPRVTRQPLWRDIVLDADARTVRVPDGVILDLGATAKALAADWAAQAAHDRTGAPVLVNLLGDLAVAGEPGRPWPVRVAERSEEPGGPVVEIVDGGVATSTTRARRWALSGRPMHHLLDPVTGLPVREHWRTVTVAAATCVDANTGSTATVVMGEAGLAWLEGTGLPARLVSADGQVTVVNGWPPDPPAGAVP